MDIVTAYHGTSSTNLKSVLRNGLIPVPQDRIWNNFKAGAVDTPSLHSLNGVYFTKQCLMTLSPALNSIERLGGETLIIMSDICKPDMHLDEDSIWPNVENAFDNVLKLERLTRYKASGLKALLDVKQKEKFCKNTFAHHLHNTLLEATVEIDYKILDDMFDACLERVLFYLYQANKQQYVSIYKSHHKTFSQPTLNFKTQEKYESRYLACIETLCEKYRGICAKKSTFRVKTVVGFNGRTKITNMFIMRKNNEIVHVYGDDQEAYKSVHKSLTIFG